MALFYNVVIGSSGTNKTLWKAVWAGLALPKVETFCWQVIRGRIAVKSELAKRRIIHNNTSCCILCLKELETVDHLFFKCPEAWKIWAAWRKLWDIFWVSPPDPSTFFLAWNSMHFVKQNCEIWKMSFFAIVWSIWLARNEVIFNGSNWDSVQTFEIARIRIAWWSKSKWKEDCHDFEDLY